MSENWVDFKAVKAAVSMEMALARYGVTLRRSNQLALRGRCPLPTHRAEDRNETFGVNTAKNAWACQSQTCVAARAGRKGGNVLDFVAAMETCSVRDAALKLHAWFMTEATGNGEERAGLPATQTAVQHENSLGANDAPNPTLNFALKGVDASHSYLASRGVAAVAETFGVGFFPGKGSMNGRVVIPIHNKDGELVAYAGRAIDDAEPRYKLPANFKKSLELFNLHRAIGASKGSLRGVVVVEGFFDAMKVYDAGYHNVVALMGSSLSDVQADLLAINFQSVILMLDCDEPGRAGVDDCLLRLGRRVWVRAVPLPDGRQPDQLSTDEILNLLAPR